MRANPVPDGANVVTIVRTITVGGKKTSKGARGSEITIAGKGFSDGDATVFIDNPVNRTAEEDADGTVNQKYFPAAPSDGTDDDELLDEGADGDKFLGTAAITDGAFSIEITVGDKFAKSNIINAIDSAGATVGEAQQATLAITGKISVDPDEISFAETLTIKVEDWAFGNISKVVFGGTNDVLRVKFENVDEDAFDVDGPKSTIEVMVPSGVRTGKHQVKVVGADGSLSGSVTVNALALEVDPTSAVPGQEVTVEGSGFLGDQGVDIRVGSNVISNRDVSGDAPRTNSGGNVNVTFTLPDADKLKALKSVGITITEKTSKREGRVNLTLGEPSVTLDPSSSGFGSEVTISGSGFSANESLDIEYFNVEDDDFEPVGIARTDSTGNFTTSFDIPPFADPGKGNDVRVTDRDEVRKKVPRQTHSARRDHIGRSA